MSETTAGVIIILLACAMVAGLWLKPTDFEVCVGMLSQDGISQSIAAERCAGLAR